MSNFPMVDILPGERIISAEEVLSLTDPVFNSRLRPDIDTALHLSSGKVGKWRVPFASGTFDFHIDIKDQGLFTCFFGRDSLVISTLLSESNPALRIQTVCALAENQGRNWDSASEEEPGRIPHEVRNPDDPQAQKIMNESGWRFPYYGSVDSTLLWLTALEEITRSNPEFLDFEIEGVSLSLHAEGATNWILQRLEDGGGYIRSDRANPKGILNQVWKDSGDSYLTYLGQVAIESGNTSVETIAQSYDALLAAAQLAKLSHNRWKITPNELTSLAQGVKENLLEHWWIGDRFAMGLGKIAGQEVLLGAVSSNQWRVLDSAILSAPDCALYVKQLVDTVCDPEILGPQGIRTLGKSNPRYRPAGYHTGSSWPVDAAIIVKGLLRYGARREAIEVAAPTISAIEAVGGYPELFRSDDSEISGVSRFIIDVWDPMLSSINRVCQPPQLLQGWTIAAYHWFRSNGFYVKG